jgi:hypothetical protein
MGGDEEIEFVIGDAETRSQLLGSRVEVVRPRNATAVEDDWDPTFGSLKGLDGTHRAKAVLGR